MAKQKTYTGQKKGASAARQSRRTRVVNGGTATGTSTKSAAAKATVPRTAEEKAKIAQARYEREHPEEQDKKKKKRFQDGMMKRFIETMVINAMVIAGLGIVIVIRGWNSTPGKVSIPVMVGLGVLIVVMFIIQRKMGKRIGR